MEFLGEESIPKKETLNYFNFIDKFLLSNTSNLDIIKEYYSKKNILKSYFNLELKDHFIIKTDKNLDIEIIQILLEDIIKTEIKTINDIKYQRRKIQNFKGLIISTNLPNLKINDYLILYHSKLFNNLDKIKIIKSFEEIDLNKSELKIVDIEEIGYENKRIIENIWIIFRKNNDNIINFLQPILNKIIEKIYSQKNYHNSFVVFYKGKLHLFLNHNDEAHFELFNLPSFLKVTLKEIDMIFFNFKNSFNKVLEIAL